MKLFVVVNDRKIFDNDFVYYIKFDNSKLFGKIKIKIGTDKEKVCILHFGNKRKKLITDITKLHPTQQILNFNN